MHSELIISQEMSPVVGDHERIPGAENRCKGAGCDTQSTTSMTADNSSRPSSGGSPYGKEYSSGAQEDPSSRPGSRGPSSRPRTPTSRLKRSAISPASELVQLPAEIHRRSSLLDLVPTTGTPTILSQGKTVRRRSSLSGPKVAEGVTVEGDSLSRTKSDAALRRVRTIEGVPAPSGGNYKDTVTKTVKRRASLKTKEDCETAKLEALRTLVESVASLNSTDGVAELLDLLTRHVLRNVGTKAFTKEDTQRGASLVETENLEKVDAVLQALKHMASVVHMCFQEVVGQILWRHRRWDALKEKAHKDAAEDIAWTVMGGIGEDPDVGSDVLNAVDAVFKKLSAESGHGGFGFRSWVKVGRFVNANPVLSRKVMQTDLDRLWYAKTHQMGFSAACATITKKDFRDLLMTWCEAMGVHPWMVFMSVGCHTLDVTASTSSESAASSQKVASEQDLDPKLLGA